MTAAQVHAQSLAQLETLDPGVFTWNGADWPCLNSSTRRRKALEPGGFSLDADLILFVRTAHFASAAAQPQLKQLLTFESRSYRIDEIVYPSGTPFLKLLCVAAARGA